MKKLWMFGLSLALGVGMSQAARQMEWLNRGLAAPAGTEVGMVVYAEIDVKYAVFV